MFFTVMVFDNSWEYFKYLYDKKVLKAMVNNSTNINKINNRLSPKQTELKRRTRHVMWKYNNLIC
jgi:hypothetical protein